MHDTAEAAAQAYDRVAIALWGAQKASSRLNFPAGDYQRDPVVASGLRGAVAHCRSAPGRPGFMLSLKPLMPGLTYGVYPTCCKIL